MVSLNYAKLNDQWPSYYNSGASVYQIGTQHEALAWGGGCALLPQGIAYM